MTKKKAPGVKLRRKRRERCGLLSAQAREIIARTKAWRIERDAFIADADIASAVVKTKR